MNIPEITPAEFVTRRDRGDADASRTLLRRAVAILPTADEQRYALAPYLAFALWEAADVEGASADLGKTAGKDAAAGKPTYPSLYGLEGSRRLATECIDRALAALDRASISGMLPPLAHWVVGRNS